ncbi:unnamed protein product [Arabidopsis arenosa]|uniref:Uncharacterized protein n=1 Tax=Arabidopsis arenosa TaxID=38785 RepID=A0A8S2B3Z2_ARAAE|nr:unnamed protein product [Arabidopsis arenosa]
MADCDEEESGGLSVTSNNNNQVETTAMRKLHIQCLSSYKD